MELPSITLSFLRNFVAVSGLVCVGIPCAEATSNYVSSSGSDNNDGTSTSKPFRTIERAADMSPSLQPGDTVYVMPGTYTAGKSNETDAGDVVLITANGTASKPITFTAYSTTRPLVDSTNCWSAFHVTGSYITIEGFEITGDRQSITASQVSTLQSETPWEVNANGINIDNRTANAKPTHDLVYNNLIHDQPGSGIEADETD